MKMFAAEVRGDLTSFIETRADTARQKVAELFMPQEMRETGQWSPELWKRAWLKARREGWRIVPVRVERIISPAKSWRAA